MNITLKFLSGRLLIYLISNETRFCLIFLFEAYFSVSSFCLTFCVCVYELGRLSTYKLEEWPCVGTSPVQILCTWQLWLVGWSFNRHGLEVPGHSRLGPPCLDSWNSSGHRRGGPGALWVGGNLTIQLEL